MRKYFTDKCKRIAIINMIFQLLRTAGTAGVALLLNWMIDNVVLSINDENESNLLWSFVICACYAALLGVIILVSGIVKARCIKFSTLHLREDLFGGIIKKSIAQFRSKNTAEYVSVMNQNISSIEEDYFKNGLSMIEDIASITIASVFLFLLNPIIAIVALVLMSIPSLIPRLFSKRLASSQALIAKKTARYNITVKDILQGFEIIKGYRIESKMKEFCDKDAEAMEDEKRKMSSLMAAVYCFANASGVAVQFLVITVAGIMAVRGYLTVGSIIAITQLTGQVITPAFQMSAKFAKLRATKPIRDEMMCMINEEIPTKVMMTESFNEISMKDISYSYDGSVNALSNINCSFENGKHYAVIGTSGSGKSTLLNLLAGNVNNYSGEMKIDGKIGLVDSIIVGQEIFLFDKTIRENITLFKDYTDEQLQRAIAGAGLSNLVELLPDGLDTKVEENGTRFSGGERQRIALARALLHGKEIILLDETTSALDSQTAKEVENTLSNMKDTTIISITHRTDENILNMYDNIILLEDGIIKAEGSYGKLKDSGMLDAYIYQELSA